MNTPYLKHKNLTVGKSVGCVIVCNGVTHTYTAPAINIKSKTEVTTQIGSKSFTVAHAANGTKSVSIVADWTVPSGSSSLPDDLEVGGGFNCDTTAVLDTIPRPSTVTSCTVDSANKITVAISRNLSANTHNIVFKLGNKSHSYDFTGTSTNYTIPNDWMTAIPNASTGSATVQVQTKSGTTLVGSAITKTVVVTVPDGSEFFPDFSLSAVRIDNDVPSAWGEYVKGRSQCTIKIQGAVGAYGSTIKSYAISGGGYSGKTATLTTGVLNTAGAISFQASVIDSRGRGVHYPVQIQVHDWKTPTVLATLSQRCDSSGVLQDEGGSVRCSLQSSYSSCGGKNQLTKTVSYRKSGTSAWSAAAVFYGDSYVLGGGQINPDASYEVRYTVADAFASVTVTDFVSTAFTTVDFRKGGRGVAFGKVSEKDVFEVAMDAEFSGGISQNGISLRCAGWTNITAASSGAAGADKGYYANSDKVTLYSITSGSETTRYIQYCVRGGIAFLRGVMGTVNAQTDIKSGTGVDFAMLPAEIRPKNSNVLFACQGSSAYTWCLAVTTGGWMRACRYSGTLMANIYLPFDVSWPL